MSVEAEAPESVEAWSDVHGTFRSVLEGLRERASVESVYGEPMESHGKTVVPVARIAYGFGGGTGSGEDGEGEGAGGGLSAKPVGVLEITDGETRFVRFGDRRRLGLALLAGLVLGVLIGRRTAGE